MDIYTESALKAILTLSSDTLKDVLFRSVGNISDFTNLKKRTITVEIPQR